MSDARQFAVLILTEVLQKGSSLSSVIEHRLNRLAPCDHALCKELCYGVMRKYFVLQQYLVDYLKRPIKLKDLDIRLLILSGIYQLKFMRIPDHAAINETVKVCKDLKKAWATALVNAILRKVQKANLIPPTIIATHPSWLVERFKTAWPQEFEKILYENQRRPPMSLRVNLQKTTRNDYLKLLTQNDIAAEAVSIPSAINLQRPAPITQLPGFAAGMVSVQDPAAQLAAMLLELEKAQTVLDACAAPGGKSTHIMEIAPMVDLTCVDSKKSRLTKLEQTLKRLGQTAKLLAGDAGNDDWWDLAEFDRILLDVPCSGTGVIRRNPDIKVLRKPKDIHKLIQTQARILTNTWKMLKPGGIMLYVTCSLLAEENEDQIEKFLAENKTAQEIIIKQASARHKKHGVQVLSIDTGWDNFYYAKLAKV